MSMFGIIFGLVLCIFGEFWEIGILLFEKCRKAYVLTVCDCGELRKIPVSNYFKVLYALGVIMLLLSEIPFCVFGSIIIVIFNMFRYFVKKYRL